MILKKKLKNGNTDSSGKAEFEKDPILTFRYVFVVSTQNFRQHSQSVVRGILFTYLPTRYTFNNRFVLIDPGFHPQKAMGQRMQHKKNERKVTQVIAFDEFFSLLRRHSVSHIGQVKPAILETSGTISLYYYSDEEVREILYLLSISGMTESIECNLFV
jgi:hypothetical protein